jgi:hypothetical protein
MDFLSNATFLTIAISAVLTFYTALLHLARRKINRFHVFRFVRGLLVGIQILRF